MSIDQQYKELRKFVAEKNGVLKMIMPENYYNHFCNVYLGDGSGGCRPSKNEMNTDIRYLLKLNADPKDLK